MHYVFTYSRYVDRLSVEIGQQLVSFSIFITTVLYNFKNTGCIAAKHFNQFNMLPIPDT
jgi:hypothetical protein